jgi:hypothetical protein
MHYTERAIMSKTIKEVAEAFAAGRKAACGNAKTDGQRYVLHGNEICRKDGAGLHFYWCGWYGTATANHMNHILEAVKPGARRVSYAQHRDRRITEFLV